MENNISTNCINFKTNPNLVYTSQEVPKKESEYYTNIIKNFLFSKENNFQEQILKEIETFNGDKSLLKKIFIKIIADEFIEIRKLAMEEIGKGENLVNNLSKNKLTILKFLKSDLGKYFTEYTLKELEFYKKHSNTVNDLLECFVSDKTMEYAINQIENLLTKKINYKNTKQLIENIDQNVETLNLINFNLEKIKKFSSKVKTLKITDCENIKNLLNNLGNTLDFVQLYSLDLDGVNIKSKSIKKLIVSSCENTNEFIQNLNKDIEHLELQDINLKNIKLNLKNFKYLKTLDLTNCKINKGSIIGLNESIQNLKLYNMDLTNFKSKINNKNLNINLTSCAGTNNFLTNYKNSQIKSLELYFGKSKKLHIHTKKLEELKVFNYKQTPIHIHYKLKEVTCNYFKLNKIINSNNIQKLNIHNDSDMRINNFQISEGFKEITFLNPCFLSNSDKALEIPKSVTKLMIKSSTQTHPYISIAKNPLDKIVLKNPNTNVYINEKLVSNKKRNLLTPLLSKITQKKPKISNEKISPPKKLSPLPEKLFTSPTNTRTNTPRNLKKPRQLTPINTPKNTPVNTRTNTPVNTRTNTPINIRRVKLKRQRQVTPTNTIRIGL